MGKQSNGNRAKVANGRYNDDLVRIGFAHRLMRSSEESIDAALYEGLNDSNATIQYTVQFPRHVTSIEKVSLTRANIGFLDLGFRLGRSETTSLGNIVGNGIVDKSRPVQPNRKKKLECSLGNIFRTHGGFTVGAVIDCSFISEMRSSIKETLQSCGVPIPLMREPHVTLARADSKKSAGILFDIAEQYLVGKLVEFEPVEYFEGRFTQGTKPVMTGVVDGQPKFHY